MEMTNSTIWKLTIIISVRVRVIVLGFGLVLLMNGCANGHPLKYESRTSLDMVSKGTEISYLANLEKRSQVKDSFNNEKENIIASKCGMEDLEARSEDTKARIAFALLVLARSGDDPSSTEMTIDKLFSDKVQALIRKVLSDEARVLRSNDNVMKVFDPNWSIAEFRENVEAQNAMNDSMVQVSISNVLSALAPLIVEIVVERIFDEIDEVSQEHLEKYSAVYKAKKRTTKFYMQTGSPRLQSSCFLFRRFPEEKPEENIKEKPSVALIGQMRITEDGSALQIRPLILYQSDTMAKSDDESYGIAASIRMNAVWRQGNSGMSEEVFNHTFLKEKITLSDPKPVLKYFPDKNWENYPFLPLPPWSTNVGSSSPAGNVEITISMAESGKPNELLKFIAKLFKSERKNWAELLKNAAEAGLR